MNRRTAIVRLVGGAAAAAAASTLPGCARARDPKRLVAYAAGPRSLVGAVARAFTDESGIEVDLFEATTGQVLAKVEAERMNPRADVLLLASGLAAEWLRREDRLAALELAPPAWSADARRRGWLDPHDRYAAMGAACVGIAARPGWERGTASWVSLLDGSFTSAEGTPGRIVMPSPSRSGSSGDFVVQWVLDEGDRAWELLVAARRRGALEVKGANNEALSSLRMGESQAILAAVDYLVCNAIGQGDALRLSFPAAGAPIVTRPVCILRSSRRLDQARAFVRFCLSPGAQRLVAEANMLPADPEVPLAKVRAAAGIPRAMPLDLDRAIAEQRAILRKFQYEVERLVVTS